MVTAIVLTMEDGTEIILMDIAHPDFFMIIVITTIATRFGRAFPFTYLPLEALDFTLGTTTVIAHLPALGVAIPTDTAGIRAFAIPTTTMTTAHAEGLGFTTTVHAALAIGEDTGHGGDFLTMASTTRTALFMA